MKTELIYTILIGIGVIAFLAWGLWHLMTAAAKSYGQLTDIENKAKESTDPYTLGDLYNQLKKVDCFHREIQGRRNEVAAYIRARIDLLKTT